MQTSKKNARVRKKSEQKSTHQQQKNRWKTINPRNRIYARTVPLQRSVKLLYDDDLVWLNDCDAGIHHVHSKPFC